MRRCWVKHLGGLPGCRPGAFFLARSHTVPSVLKASGERSVELHLGLQLGSLLIQNG